MDRTPHKKQKVAHSHGEHAERTEENSSLASPVTSTRNTPPKRRIPGPIADGNEEFGKKPSRWLSAGAGSSRNSTSNSSIPGYSATHPIDFSLFDKPAWRFMMKQLKKEGKKIPQDLGQIQEMRTSRVERLAVILIDVKTHGLAFKVTVMDPSGFMSGTLTAGNKPANPGDVLILEKVSFLFLNGSCQGINITPSNIMEVIPSHMPPGDDEDSSSPSSIYETSTPPSSAPASPASTNSKTTTNNTTPKTTRNINNNNTSSNNNSNNNNNNNKNTSTNNKTQLPHVVSESSSEPISLFETLSSPKKSMPPNSNSSRHINSDPKQMKITDRFPKSPPKARPSSVLHSTPTSLTTLPPTTRTSAASSTTTVTVQTTTRTSDTRNTATTNKPTSPTATTVIAQSPKTSLMHPIPTMEVSTTTTSTPPRYDIRKLQQERLQQKPQSQLQSQSQQQQQQQQQRQQQKQQQPQQLLPPQLQQAQKQPKKQHHQPQQQMSPNLQPRTGNVSRDIMEGFMSKITGNKNNSNDNLQTQQHNQQQQPQQRQQQQQQQKPKQKSPQACQPEPNFKHSRRGDDDGSDNTEQIRRESGYNNNTANCNASKTVTSHTHNNNSNNGNSHNSNNKSNNDNEEDSELQCPLPSQPPASSPSPAPLLVPFAPSSPPHIAPPAAVRKTRKRRIRKFREAAGMGDEEEDSIDEALALLSPQSQALPSGSQQSQVNSSPDIKVRNTSMNSINDGGDNDSSNNSNDSYESLHFSVDMSQNQSQNAPFGVADDMDTDDDDGNEDSMDEEGADDEEDNSLFEVERILADREIIQKNRTYKEYYIKWKGYGHQYDLWVPEWNIVECTRALAQYERRKTAGLLPRRLHRVNYIDDDDDEEQEDAADASQDESSDEEPNGLQWVHKRVVVKWGDNRWLNGEATKYVAKRGYCIKYDVDGSVYFHAAAELRLESQLTANNNSNKEDEEIEEEEVDEEEEEELQQVATQNLTMNINTMVSLLVSCSVMASQQKRDGIEEKDSQEEEKEGNSKHTSSDSDSDSNSDSAEDSDSESVSNDEGDDGVAVIATVDAVMNVGRKHLMQQQKSQQKVNAASPASSHSTRSSSSRACTSGTRSQTRKRPIPTQATQASPKKQKTTFAASPLKIMSQMRRFEDAEDEEEEMEELKEMCSQFLSENHGSLPNPTISKELEDRLTQRFSQVADRLHKGDGLVVLSLFDGIGAALFVIARRLGIRIKRYYTSEVNKYAAMIVRRQFPDVDIVPLGDITKITKDMLEDEVVDLMVGGFPCKDLSPLKRDRKGLEGPQSRLFYNMCDVFDMAKENNPEVLFLVENVYSMPVKDKDIITQRLGVEPIYIDAVKVSAARRQRYYWTNIKRDAPFIPNPQHANDFLSQGRKSIQPFLNCITTGNTIAKFQNRGVKWCLAHAKELKRYNLVLDEYGHIDCLRVTEIERILGFVTNYTKVPLLPKNKRKQLLGDTFSIPVVEYLLSPLLKLKLK